MPIHYVREKAVCRKIKTLSIEAGMFLFLLKELDFRRMLKAEGLPEDARVVGLTVDDQYNTFKLYLESSEFEDVLDGVVFPELIVTFSTWIPRIGDRGEMIFEQEAVVS